MINFCPQCGSAVQEAEAFGKLRRVCPSCGYIHFQNPKVAAVTFVQQAGKVLLVQRAVYPEIGKWALPAGYIDLGEDPQQGAIRETQEETGLTIEIINLLDVIFNADQNPPVIVIVYAARVIGGMLCAADDVHDAQWFAPDNLPELAFASTRQMIERWINHQF